MKMPAGMRRHAGGFSLIEVMIALVVLAFGLLGLALLQTMNLRYTQNANQRTQAVNLAGELVDMIRSNRSEMAQYAMNENMSAVVVPAAGCPTQATLGSANNITRWKCEVREALGGDAQVVVTADATTGQVGVTIRWNDDNLDASTATALANSGEISMGTRL